MLCLFTGLNPLVPSSGPTGMQMYEVGDANTRYLVDDVIKDQSNT